MRINSMNTSLIIPLSLDNIEYMQHGSLFIHRREGYTWRLFFISFEKSALKMMLNVNRKFWMSRMSRAAPCSPPCAWSSRRTPCSRACRRRWCRTGQTPSSPWNTISRYEINFAGSVSHLLLRKLCADCHKLLKVNILWLAQSILESNGGWRGYFGLVRE